MKLVFGVRRGYWSMHFPDETSLSDIIDASVFFSFVYPELEMGLRRIVTTLNRPVFKLGSQT